MLQIYNKGSVTIIFNFLASHEGAHEISTGYRLKFGMLPCWNLNWCHCVFSISRSLSELIVIVKAPAVNLLLWRRIWRICFCDDQAMSSTSSNIFHNKFFSCEPIDFRHDIYAIIFTGTESSKVSFSAGENFSLWVKRHGKSITSGDFDGWELFCEAINYHIRPFACFYIKLITYDS